MVIREMSNECPQILQYRQKKRKKKKEWEIILVVFPLKHVLQFLFGEQNRKSTLLT